VRPLVFCHIPKTGGTSIHRFISAAYGVDSVSENVDSENYSSAVHALARYSAIIGHFWFRPGEQLDPNRLNVTVLRDPVDRVVSQYYFYRQLGPTIHPSAPERSMELQSYVTSELPTVLAATSNFQTRLLAPLGLSLESVDPSDNDLLLAAQRAVDSFDLVGIFPDLEDTAACILCLGRVYAGIELPRENASRGRPAIADISDKVRRRLESLNELDRELYSYVAGRFLQRRRQLFIGSVNELIKHELPADSIAMVSGGTRNQSSSTNRAVVPSAPLAPRRTRFGNRRIEVVGVNVEGQISLGAGMLIAGENVTLTARIAAHESTEDLTVGLHIHDSDDRLVFGTNTWLLGRRISVSANSQFSVQFAFRNILGVGRYRVGLALHTGQSHLDCCYDWFDDCCELNVVGAIGYHFEGSMALALSAEFAQIDGDAPGIAEAPGRPGAAVIARHNPAITDVRGSVRLIGDFAQMRSGDVVSLEVELESGCDQALEFTGQRPTRVCYRWLDSVSGIAIQREGMRTSLGVDVPPGSVHRVHLVVASPPNFLGNAILRVVPVQENVGWFDELGSFYHDIPVLVSA
jgi:Wzt C-terminal domain/Sulfotransferase family